MDIIFKGYHNQQEALESVQEVLSVFQKRYGILGFREMHLVVTLVDAEGSDVELVDSETSKRYHTFEVYREGFELEGIGQREKLKLVVDNTKSNVGK